MLHDPKWEAKHELPFISLIELIAWVILAALVCGGIAWAAISYSNARMEAQWAPSLRSS